VQAPNIVSAAPGRPAATRSFVRFAIFLIGFLLFVILFGAWVRISGSGAGCGDHWPTCHGEIVPRSPSVQTLIEYTHRLTSGTLGLFALALPIWAFRLFPSGHPVRRFALATFILVLVEAGIGAGLVLRQLVALDASVARAVAVAVHLTNTLLLTGSAALTAAFAQRASAVSAGAEASGAVAAGGADAGRDPLSVPRKGDGVALVSLLCGLAFVAATGAVTALGDTLFPVHGLSGQIPPADHFLVQLRVLHPILACAVVISSILVALRFVRMPGCQRWAAALGVLAGVQLLLGITNIAVGAPGWLQLAHLLGAQLTWLSAVLLTSSRSRTAPSPSATSRSTPSEPAPSEPAPA
jgi:cytochrome c oxidase assembly protein subunit 15